MQSNSIIGGIKGVGLGLFMMLGIITFSSVEANAQWRGNNDRNDRNDRRDDRDRNGNWGRNNGGYNNGGNSLYNRARQQGYQDGMSAGEGHGRDRERYNPEKSSYYKKATNGYESYMRDKDAYKNAYRQAFTQGYSEGYRRYSGRDNNRGNNRGGNRGW